MRGAWPRSAPNPWRVEENEEDLERMNQDERDAEDGMDLDNLTELEDDGTHPPTRRRPRTRRIVEDDQSDEENDYGLDYVDANDNSDSESADFGPADDGEYDGWYEAGAYYSASSYHSTSSPASPSVPSHQVPTSQPNMTQPDDLDVAGMCFDPWGERMYVAGVKSARLQSHPSLDSPGAGSGGRMRMSGPGVGYMTFAPSSPPSERLQGYEGVGGIGIGGTGDMGLGPGVVVEWGVRGAEKRFWVDEGWM